MAITVSANSSGFDPVSDGVHIASCISVIDLGMQDVIWQGTEKKQHKIMLTWEVPDEMIEVEGEEKPRVISKEYTASLSDKAKLREHLEAWRGKKFTETELNGFDLRNILGKPCQLQVLHVKKDNGNIYANIGSIMAVPKGVQTPPIIHELTYFDLMDPSCLTMLDGLASWIKEKVMKSETYQNLIQSQNDTSDDFQEITPDGDLPF